MSRGYGQYCPLALAAELLCQRWTILVVSRLHDGCSRFNEIHAGVPGMSPSLLSKRLDELEQAGLLVRRPLPRVRGHEYVLTEAGRATEPLVMGMASWGQQWARDMELRDLDPAFLLWSMHTRIDAQSLPERQVVLEFCFSGCPGKSERFWLVCNRGAVEMCLKDPGLEPDVQVCSDLRLFVEAWRGFRDLEAEIAAGRIQVHGPETLTRRLPTWLLGSSLAEFPRRRGGREHRLWARTGRAADH